MNDVRRRRRSRRRGGNESVLLTETGRFQQRESAQQQQTHAAKHFQADAVSRSSRRYFRRGGLFHFLHLDWISAGALADKFSESISKLVRGGGDLNTRIRFSWLVLLGMMGKVCPCLEIERMREHWLAFYYRILEKAHHCRVMLRNCTRGS